MPSSFGGLAYSPRGSIQWVCHQKFLRYGNESFRRRASHLPVATDARSGQDGTPRNQLTCGGPSAAAFTIIAQEPI